MDRVWWTTSQLACRWGYTDRFVRRQVELGRIDAIAFVAGSRRTYRIHRDEVRRFERLHFRPAGDLADR